MPIYRTRRAISFLVGNRPIIAQGNKVLYCTISPRPDTLHDYRTVNQNGRMVKCKLKYKHMRKKDQYEHCLEILEKAYLTNVAEDYSLVGVAELNSTGNVHLHFLLYCSNVQNKYQLSDFRTEVSLMPISLKNRKSMNIPDFCNNIVFCENIDETIKYLEKDNKMATQLFPNYTNVPYKEESKGLDDIVISFPDTDSEIESESA